MTSAENLPYHSTVQVVKKINYIHIEKIYIYIYSIYNTNSTLTYMYDQSMLDVLGLYFTLTLFLFFSH